MGKTFITNNYPNLKIAERERFQGQINTLRSDLHKSCTPEVLNQAERIADEFRKSIAFKYVSAENSIFDLAVYKLNHLHNSLMVCFVLNGRQVTLTLPDFTIVKRRGRPQEVVNDIREAIVEELTKTLLPKIILEVLQ